MKNGGKILFNEYVKNVNGLNISESRTLEMLNSKSDSSINYHRLKDSWLKVKGATIHNLKNLNVNFRLNALNVVTGVSGAGKSSLVFELLGKYYNNTFKNESTSKLQVVAIETDQEIKKIIEIDQTPIGRTPRSNPATYSKVFDHIRKLFATLPESKKNKWTQGYFSFNTKGGRCEVCEGAGTIQTGMHFLSNVETLCENCQGKRYEKETLEIKYKGKSIAEILEMEISNAVEFFIDEPRIHHYLEIMNELGLGYLSLGQSATTLSGGEAQRLKLISELVKPTKDHTLYLFDEPTTGLHSYDIKILIQAIKNLTRKGHTVIVIEHDSEIIKSADHIVDLGPDGGDNGGQVMFAGSYIDLLKSEKSYTAQALNNNLAKISHPKIDLEKIIEAPISLKGVNTHNLKNIDVEIPRNKLTVITGVSGSGKSSLAFDTIFAEGQFRFTESFSTYARTLIQQKAKPNIVESNGITPTIAIDGKSVTKNPRATVGTVTGLYDLYRLLYSRISIGEKRERCNELSSYFSFNHQSGTCPKCNGLGFEYTCDPDKLITNPEMAIYAGAMKGSKPGLFYGDPYGQHMAILQKVGEKHSIDYNVPWKDLSQKAKEIALYGTGATEYDVSWKYKRKNREGTHQFKGAWQGLCYLINDEFIRKQERQGLDSVAVLMKQVNCSECKGSRLKSEVLKYKIDGKSIHDISQFEATDAIGFFRNLEQKLNKSEFEIANDLIKSIIEKLQAMCQIGLGYLSANRTTMTLSGGEGRRVRMISQIGGELIGITYVLDEPTVGLHPKDSKNLIKLLKKLSEENTVVVVEHDEDVIKSADYLIELGHGAGIKGGEIIAKGEKIEFLKNTKSLTSKYLNNSFDFSSEKTELELDFNLNIQKARVNNLKDIDISLPINGLTVFSGVSGSGKTSLVFDVIGESTKYNRNVNCKEISGFEHFESVFYMDQTPIGKNSLSTPATFLGLYDEIRNLFAKTDQAKEAKLKSAHFTFNSKAGQCENCKGQGQIKVSMDFLSDVFVICPVCNGQRFKNEVLRVNWNNLNVYEILEKTIDEAAEIFNEEKRLNYAFSLLKDLGLGHLKLGQSATTLSGGESQRIKLAKELIKTKKAKSLYLLDEPTTGLHFADIEKLIKVLYNLRAEGHALYVVEHHPWLLKAADHIVELGPDGGEKGGYILK